MANYYTSFCTEVVVPADKRPAVQEALTQCESMQVEEIGETGFEAAGIEVRWTPEGNLQLEDTSQGFVSLDFLSELLLAVAHAMESDEPIQVEWAHVCDKSRPDAFSGGGLLVRRNQPHVCVEVSELLHRVREGQLDGALVDSWRDEEDQT